MSPAWFVQTSSSFYYRVLTVQGIDWLDNLVWEALSACCSDNSLEVPLTDLWLVGSPPRFRCTMPRACGQGLRENSIKSGRYQLVSNWEVCFLTAFVICLLSYCRTPLFCRLLSLPIIKMLLELECVLDHLFCSPSGLPPKFFVCGIFFLVPLWENTNLYGNKNQFHLFFLFVFKHIEW